MDRYIGLDGHSQSCTLRVLTAAGKEVGRQVVETNGAALVQAVRAIPGSKHLCLEEGAQSSWLYELLRTEVDEIVVTVPARRAGSKDDAQDALELAEGLRTGAIKRRVYKRCGPYSELRAAVRNYTILTRDVARAKNRLKALYLSRAIQLPGEEVYQPAKHERWERMLPSFFTVPTATFGVLFGFLVLAHERRRVLHFNVTANPSAEWTARQLVQAFPEERVPRFLVRDRDGVYGDRIRHTLDVLGIEEVITAARSPWQNAFAERSTWRTRNVTVGTENKSMAAMPFRWFRRKVVQV